MIEDLTDIEEIAAALGMTPNHVRVTLHNASRKLREHKRYRQIHDEYYRDSRHGAGMLTTKENL